MEKRIGSILIAVENRVQAKQINAILSEHADIIIGRMGLPSSEAGVSIISLVIEGTVDEASSLTGKLGRVPTVNLKSAFLK